MSHDFFHTLSVAEVVSLLEAISPLPAESCALADPAGLEGRVLAEALLAKDHVPLTSRAGMDGYAVRAADTFGASEGNPAYLECVGHWPIDQIPDKVLLAGQCAGIVTGGIIPQGADAVVMVEYTHGMDEYCVEVRRAVPPGEYVMLAGEDARAGECALKAGTVLRAQEVGLAAAVGASTVLVHRRPRVGILSTGDEVLPVEASPRPGQVRDVNSHALAALVRKCGGLPSMLGIVPDTLDALQAALQQGAEHHDVILLSGGSSVGVRDLTVQALTAMGQARIFCHGVALSPGKPLILAQRGKTIIWGLPGQVASAQVVMMVLGLPFLRHLAGYQQAFCQRQRFQWPQCRARLARNVASRQGREDYVRVRLREGTDARGHSADEAAMPLAVPVLGMSGLLRTLISSEGLIRIPANVEGLEQGTVVDVLFF